MTTSAVMETATNTAPETGFRFLDLPGELRNQIYDCILPDLGHVPIKPDDSVRKDGQRSYTNLMATCHQIYDEASSWVYNFKEFRVDVDPHGTLEVFNQTVETVDPIEPVDLTPLNNVRVLHLNIGEISPPLEFGHFLQGALFHLVRPSQQARQVANP